jgi:hypothetical protein
MKVKNKYKYRYLYYIAVVLFIIYLIGIGIPDLTNENKMSFKILLSTSFAILFIYHCINYFKRNSN